MGIGAIQNIIFLYLSHSTVTCKTRNLCCEIYIKKGRCILILVGLVNCIQKGIMVLY